MGRFYAQAMPLEGFSAGLIAWMSHPIIGVVLTLSGLALMIHSLVGFYRIKRLEYADE